MISITKKNIEKLTIKADRLDPIGVFVEDFEPGKAKVTIEVYGEAWSHYWGGMGEGLSLREFFTDIPYLVTKFCRDSIHEIDYETISKKAGVDIDVTTALYYEDELTEAYGKDWRMDLPRKSTREYEYLTRIVEAIKQAFQNETTMKTKQGNGGLLYSVDSLIWFSTPETAQASHDKRKDR